MAFNYVFIDGNKCKRVSFDYLKHNNKLPFEGVRVDIYVFDNKHYSSNGELQINIYDSELYKYTNVVNIEKDNIKIVVTEYTDVSRSEQIQDSIEYIMSLFLSFDKVE